MDAIELVAALEQPNVRAFLWMLRHGEGTQGENGYRTMFGGGLFDSFADHPRQAITRNGLTSTAAGAYQFLARTWDGLVKQYGFRDFTPDLQDLGCVALIAGRKALDDVIAGRFETAVLKCNKEWASLPGSPYGQPVVTMAVARQQYEAAGGTFAEQPRPLPLYQLGPEPIATLATPLPKEKPMAPFLLAALPALLELVPKLGQVFGSGSEMSQRNLKAAEVVVAAAKEAIGARNEQELIESIASDPAAADAVKKSIEDVWFQITEVGGGIQAARVAAAKYVDPGAKSFAANPAFWISIILLAMPFMLLADVFYVHPESYVAELRTQIVTGVLMVVSVVGAFWLGSSMGSQKKDDLRK
jgi:muramidase (phage lysozyme)